MSVTTMTDPIEPKEISTNGARNHDADDVLAMKILVRHLVAQGMSYNEIGEKTNICANAIKQFVHRKSYKPRKTLTYFSLLKLFRELNRDGQLEEICGLDSKASSAYKILLSRPNISSKFFDISQIQDLITERNIPTEFNPDSEYFFYRSLCADDNRSYFLKSKLIVEKKEYEFSYTMHSCDRLNNNKTINGAIRQYGSNIYLLGSISGKKGIEVTCFQLPQSDCESVIPVVTLTLNSCWVPVCTNGLLVSGEKISNKEIGVISEEQDNLGDEKFFIDIISKSHNCIAPLS